jgi:hypothetical protein
VRGWAAVRHTAGCLTDLEDRSRGQAVTAVHYSMTNLRYPCILPMTCLLRYVLQRPLVPWRYLFQKTKPHAYATRTGCVGIVTRTGYSRRGIGRTIHSSTTTDLDRRLAPNALPQTSAFVVIAYVPRTSVMDRTDDRCLLGSQITERCTPYKLICNAYHRKLETDLRI